MVRTKKNVKGAKIPAKSGVAKASGKAKSKARQPRAPSEGLMNHPDLAKILRKGGVSRAKKDVIKTMNTAAHTFLGRILHAAILIALQGKRVTVTVQHLKAACSVLGIQCAVGVNPTAAVTPSLVTGPSYPRRKAGGAGEASEAEGAEGERKKRKFKQGTVSTREMAFHQRKDALVFRKLTFKRFCKNLAQSTKISSFPKVDLTTLRFSKNILVILQVVCERHLIGLARGAALLATQAGQKTVSSERVETVTSLVRDCGMFQRLV